MWHCFIVVGMYAGLDRGFDELKRTVSYDARCLARGCPAVTMGVRGVESEK